MFKGINPLKIDVCLIREGYKRHDTYESISASGENSRPIRRNETGLIDLELNYFARKGLEVLVIPGELVNGKKDTYVFYTKPKIKALRFAHRICNL